MRDLSLLLLRIKIIFVSSSSSSSPIAVLLSLFSSLSRVIDEKIFGFHYQLPSESFVFAF